MAEMWRQAAESKELNLDVGERANGREKQHMFGRKRERCQRTYYAPRRPGVPGDRLD